MSDAGAARLLFARIDFAIRRDDMLTPDEQLAKALANASAASAGEVFYVLACLECGGPDHPLPMPFGSPGERSRWAGQHTRATGHDRWFVIDQPASDPR